MMACNADMLIRNAGKLFIGGSWVTPSTGSKIDVITPSSEDLFVQVAEAQEADIDAAVAAAREAFDNGPWPRMSHVERASYMREMAREIRARSDDLCTIWTSEVGAVTSLSQMAIPGTADIFEFYAGLAETYPWQERHVPQAGGEVGLLVREPVGVVGAIVAWNGALGLIAYKIAPALIAGCTVIIKSSPESPGSALVIAEIAEKVGLPAGVLNVVTADREASERLVRHPGVDKIAFTGSTAAGKKIGAICGGRVARCTLELGGKSAGIILDDYDLGAAAASLAGSTSIMCGQVCSSLTRVIVSRHRQDELLEAMAANFAAIKVGDPFDPAMQMGPLAMRRQRDRVEAYIAKGLHEGATLVTGGRRPAHLNRGFYIEPTIFGCVDNDMTIAREEIFGPVVSVIAADSEDQAIAIANDSDFGLNASVFTNDPERAYRISRRLRSGTVGHNGFRSDFSIAFGGFKQSGIGREGGREGLLPYLEAKTVILDAEPASLREQP